ncbi:MAG TPA: anhydro-N-acetylmuramic acid kinase [Flavisolibacter sp.]|jgi:anhydro-N-acetylmuramic acid kinase|nr:anhydro-N-acetylmuramic acid kinase [Flavisolibacter sp.]
MVYRAIGLMSGSSLDGLDIAFAELNEQAGQWSYEILAADCLPYSVEWKEKLQNATSLNALDYQLLHTAYGHYLGQMVNRFIDANNLHFKVGLIGSHGHTTFHVPEKLMTAQLGDGAALAAETGLPVVSDLRALDVAFGGQGAPIVPIGERLLLKDYDLYLNLGGIANISFNDPDHYTAFDICAANRVLNMIAAKVGKEYDAGGKMAAEGAIYEELLTRLNAMDYYALPAPKSLANDFGTDTVYPVVASYGLSQQDELRTYVEHIVIQIAGAIATHFEKAGADPRMARKLLVTGGGYFNTFLIERLREALGSLQVEVILPDTNLAQYKEALIMAFMGVLRWRQEYNVMASVTGASRNSINGALWIGQEA